MIYIGFMFLVQGQFMHVKHTHNLLQLCLGGLQCNSTLKALFSCKNTHWQKNVRHGLYSSVN